MLLSGRRAIVTGAGRGIGAATARVLDAAGARVALVARSGDELDETAAGLTNDPVVVVADLGTPDGPTTAVTTAVEQLGGLDVLVNNAGIGLRKPSEELTADEIDRVWNVNVRSALLATTAALPSLLESGHASVISISSITGLRGAPWRAAYAASKAALDGMTRSLAMEYGPRGIRFNTVAPGVVETDLWRENLARPGVTDAVLGLIPTRRLSDTAEVADAVMFLASDLSRAITGEVISADGGMNSTLNLWPTV